MYCKNDMLVYFYASYVTLKSFYKHILIGASGGQDTQTVKKKIDNSQMRYIISCCAIYSQVKILNTG